MVRALIIHGGAGAWRVRPGVEKSIEAVKNCTKQAWSILIGSNNALDAVVEAVKCMENSGYLNAGLGSVPNILGERELDAGLMTSTGLIGAVAAVKATRNPIMLARIIAEKTPHVIIAGENADKLSLVFGLPPLPPMPAHVVERYKDSLKKVFGGDISESYYEALKTFVENNRLFYDVVRSLMNVFDTVGAVAVDDNGLLAAATSTGGVMLKLPGRVGDTPIPGAGFYASNSIACSATGWGEFIIRSMPCLKLHLEYEATRDIRVALSRVMEHVNKSVGLNTLGFIGVNERGDLFYAYNTEAMLIGYVASGEVVVELKPEPSVKVIEVK